MPSEILSGPLHPPLCTLPCAQSLGVFLLVCSLDALVPNSIALTTHGVLGKAIHELIRVTTSIHIINVPAIEVNKGWANIVVGLLVWMHSLSALLPVQCHACHDLTAKRVIFSGLKYGGRFLNTVKKRVGSSVPIPVYSC